MFNYSFFVGIDVSKAVIDVSFFSNGQVVYLGQYFNDESDFESVIKDLSFKTNIPIDQWMICFENTGSYSKALLYWLISQGIPCLEENPLAIKKSLGLRRGKSDKMDSKDICYYAFEKRDKITPTILDKPFVIQLKSLLSRRDLLVKHRTALKASLKEQKSSMLQELYVKLDHQNTLMIKFYNEQIKALEQEIQQVINSDHSAAKNNELIQTIIGIGSITAAYFIGTTNNFESFTNSRKYSCYIGAAPFPDDSGTKKGKTRVSAMAYKKMKSLLSNGVISAIGHDPEIGLYFKRKKKEGKKSGVVYNAIKNKLIHRVFAVVNRQTPYVKMMNYV